MSAADIDAARSSFRVDTTMTADEAAGALAALASVVQREAETATAEAEGAGDSAASQSRADALEDLASELENITVEVDTECPACAGEGAVACDGGGPDTPCPGDESCPVCEGETTMPCTRCEGSGETADPTLTDDSVREVTAAVDEAFGRLP